MKYKAAVRSKKGVVGNRGTNIPIMPNANEMLPRIINNVFIARKDSFLARSAKVNAENSIFAPCIEVTLGTEYFNSCKYVYCY